MAGLGYFTLRSNTSPPQDNSHFSIDTDTSDFDFLVDFFQGASFFDQFQMQQELSEFLKAPVDVISIHALKPRDSDIRKEALVL